jgi:hypothetical protein
MDNMFSNNLTSIDQEIIDFTDELLRRFEKSQKQIKELVKQIKSGKMPNFGGQGFGFN